ncbi:MAG TPA: hypothetical protein DCP02_07550 [Actinobacteria bacterium]|nr:hypothetical protein [Actinomycetota bacterium]
MNIRKFWFLIIAVCLSVILAFSIAGCRGKVSSGRAVKDEAPEEEKLESEQTLESLEQPDKELFDKYFSHISLCGTRGFFGGNVEDNISTFLPHQEGCLSGSFKNRNNNFIFKSEVLDLEIGESVERCAMTSSSFESAGFYMEILEWAFLHPGSYEYRIYVEDTLVAVLPFEVVSYLDYFKAWIDKAKSSVIKNILR